VLSRLKVGFSWAGSGVARVAAVVWHEASNSRFKLVIRDTEDRIKRTQRCNRASRPIVRKQRQEQLIQHLSPPDRAYMQVRLTLDRLPR